MGDGAARCIPCALHVSHLARSLAKSLHRSARRSSGQLPSTTIAESAANCSSVCSLGVQPPATERRHIVTQPLSAQLHQRRRRPRTATTYQPEKFMLTKARHARLPGGTGKQLSCQTRVVTTYTVQPLQTKRTHLGQQRRNRVECLFGSDVATCRDSLFPHPLQQKSLPGVCLLLLALRRRPAPRVKAAAPPQLLWQVAARVWIYDGSWLSRRLLGRPGRGGRGRHSYFVDSVRNKLPHDSPVQHLCGLRLGSLSADSRSVRRVTRDARCVKGRGANRRVSVGGRFPSCRLLF